MAGLQWAENPACILAGVLAASKGMPSEMIIFYLIKIPVRKMLMFSTCHLVPALPHLSALFFKILIVTDTVMKDDQS